MPSRENLSVAAKPVLSMHFAERFGRKGVMRSRGVSALRKRDAPFQDDRRRAVATDRNMPRESVRTLTLEARSGLLL